jgi:GGDEF domain-containing protein
LNYFVTNEHSCDRQMDILSLGLNESESPEKQRASMPAEIIQHLQILIRGISLHAVEGDPEDLGFLRQRMSSIADALNDESSADDLLVGIGKTLHAFEEYNRRSGVISNGQLDELRGMLSTMTAAIIFITSSSETSVKQLNVVEAKLQRANTLEDMRRVRESLSDCLTLVRGESRRLQTETRAKIEALTGDVQRLSSRLRSTSSEDSQDPVTGLPGRLAAEEAIKTKIAAGRQFVIALYTLDRIASINGRFGRQVGDEILVNGARMLAQRLAGTTLYRWSGPAFAAVFDPSVNVATAESRAQQAASLRWEKNIESDDRTVLIVVTYSCHLERISAQVLPDSMFKSMDAFVAARGMGGALA